MDPRLLRYYNQELQHLREMGAEFAQQFPKIAARLRMEGIEVGDPYVERLLEGFAFLAARIQLKLDAEFPRFTERLLEIVYPNYLAPTPSMMVAQVQPMTGDAALGTGARIPRGSEIRSGAIRGTRTECRFRTGQSLELWPIELGAVSYFSHAANLPLTRAPEWRKYAGGLRIRLEATAGLDFSRIQLQDLRLFCSANDEVAYKLHELICGHALGALVLPIDGAGEPQVLYDTVRPVGFDDDEALLPRTLTGFSGYRLLQEYFTFAQRFLFFDLQGLGAALRAVGGQKAEVVLLFAKGDPSLQQAVGPDALALHCVTAINLFEQRCDRIQVSPRNHDFHVVVDRARPMDFEIIELTEVSGFGQGVASEKVFKPLYAAFHKEEQGHDAYFATQREPRLLSERQKRDGPRSSYIGSEVYLTVVDSSEAPYPGSLQQLAIKALCSNRDLPTLLAAAEGGLRLELTSPVESVRVIKGPSRPLSAMREGRLAWRFINQLSLNHLSLLDADADQGAAALRALLRLYAQESDSAKLRQVDGLRSVRCEPVVRRLPMGGPISFGRGVRIDLEVDELAFQGASPFLLGCVLERHFARHVSMNGFTELHVRSPGRGEILAGKPMIGKRPIV